MSIVLVQNYFRSPQRVERLDDADRLRCVVNARMGVPRELSASRAISQYDRYARPLMEHALSAPNLNRNLLCFEPRAGVKWALKGKDIADLLVQVREAITQLASVSPENRSNQTIQLKFPKGEHFSVRAGAIPKYLDQMFQTLLPPNAIEGDDYIEISPAQVQELASFERSIKDDLIARLKSWIVDPHNPEKGKKYVHSLFAIRQHLRYTFPNWPGKVLPYLAGEASHSLFAKHAYFAFNALLQNGESDVNIRAQYAFIIEQAKRALDLVSTERFENEKMKQTLQMLQALCHARFTKVHMYPFFDDFLPNVLRAPQADLFELPKFSWETLAVDLDRANRRLLNIPPEYTLNGYANADLNAPWVHSIQRFISDGQERTCTILRHTAPLCDQSLFGRFISYTQSLLGFEPLAAQVMPEFHAHLSSNPDKHTLYVHQEVHPQSGKQTIQKLEDHPNFHFLSLPLEGPIWSVAMLDVDQIKANLLDSLLNQKNGFALPRRVEQARMNETAQSILEKVHRLYFDNRPLNSIEKKQAFILLFYSELKDHFVHSLKADYCVSVSDDHSGAVVDMVKNLIKLGRENEAERLREVYISTLAPFVIHHQALRADRFEKVLVTVSHLTSLQAQKEAIRKDHSEGQQLIGQEVPKEEVSWSQMVGPKQFRDCVVSRQRLREKRVVLIPDFSKALASTYLKDGVWNLPRLRHQIQRDTVVDVRINGERIVSFEQLCQIMKVEPKLFEQIKKDSELTPRAREALYYMAMLQQGSGAECMRDPSLYLNGNQLGFVVGEVEMSAARKRVIEIINISSSEPERALKMSQDAPSDEMKRYLFSAVSTGLLPEAFLPEGNFKDPIPVFPTRIYGKYEWGVIQELQVLQELELRDPMKEQLGYPIEAVAFVQSGEGAKVSWQIK